MKGPEERVQRRKKNEHSEEWKNKKVSFFRDYEMKLRKKLRWNEIYACEQLKQVEYI